MHQAKRMDFQNCSRVWIAEALLKISTQMLQHEEVGSYLVLKTNTQK